MQIIVSSLYRFIASGTQLWFKALFCRGIRDKQAEGEQIASWAVLSFPVARLSLYSNAQCYGTVSNL
jgi:hypothetical protein